MLNRALALLFMFAVWGTILGLVVYEACEILSGVESQLIRFKSLDEMNDGHY